MKYKDPSFVLSTFIHAGEYSHLHALVWGKNKTKLKCIATPVGHMFPAK